MMRRVSNPSRSVDCAEKGLRLGSMKSLKPFSDNMMRRVDCAEKGLRLFSYCSIVRLTNKAREELIGESEESQTEKPRLVISSRLPLRITALTSSAASTRRPDFRLALERPDASTSRWTESGQQGERFVGDAASSGAGRRHQCPGQSMSAPFHRASQAG